MALSEKEFNRKAGICCSDLVRGGQIPPLFQDAKEPGTNGSDFSISSGIFVCHSKLKPCALITASRRRIPLKLSLMKENEQKLLKPERCGVAQAKCCSSTATLVIFEEIKMEIAEKKHSV